MSDFNFGSSHSHTTTAAMPELESIYCYQELFRSAISSFLLTSSSPLLPFPCLLELPPLTCRFEHYSSAGPSSSARSYRQIVASSQQHRMARPSCSNVTCRMQVVHSLSERIASNLGSCNTAHECQSGTCISCCRATQSFTSVVELIRQT